MVKDKWKVTRMKAIFSGYFCFPPCFTCNNRSHWTVIWGFTSALTYVSTGSVSPCNTCTLADCAGIQILGIIVDSPRNSSVIITIFLFWNIFILLVKHSQDTVPSCDTIYDRSLFAKITKTWRLFSFFHNTEMQLASIMPEQTRLTKGFVTINLWKIFEQHIRLNSRHL